MNKFVKYYFPVILWLLFIFIVSNIFKDNGLGRSIPNLDKIVHFVEFGILGYLLIRAFYLGLYETDSIKSFLMAFGISVFIAAADEMYQIYVPNRTASISDFIADFGGIVVSQAAFFIFVIKNNRS